MIDKLLEQYWEVSMERGPDLEGFVARLADGEFGDIEATTITEFLREVEAITIANIETKAGEGGHFADMKDDVIEETRGQVAELIGKYGA